MYNLPEATMNDIQPYRFQSPGQWRDWLAANHASQDAAWLVISKSHVKEPGVHYEAALEEALCFGWIDGVMKSIDGDTYLLRFSPRKRRSPWSVSNIGRVERLTEQGRMTEAGLAKIREAQENGEWEAAARRDDATRLPDDLREALDQNAAAREYFDRLAPSRKKQFLNWIESARTEKTRQERIGQTVAMTAEGKRLGQN
jgi:uncharacterized protein YdeI (YjbR/CyaY-like superfamily)